MLTLGQKSYLCELLSKVTIYSGEQLWDLCEKIDNVERRELLGLYDSNKELLKARVKALMLEKMII